MADFETINGMLQDTDKLTGCMETVKDSLTPCLVELSEGIMFDNYGTINSGKERMLNSVVEMAGVLADILDLSDGLGSVLKELAK